MPLLVPVPPLVPVPLVPVVPVPLLPLAVVLAAVPLPFGAVVAPPQEIKPIASTNAAAKEARPGEQVRERFSD